MSRICFSYHFYNINTQIFSLVLQALNFTFTQMTHLVSSFVSTKRLRILAFSPA